MNIALAATAATGLLALGIAGPAASAADEADFSKANGVDRRPCVSLRESHSKQIKDMARRQLEERWEVNARLSRQENIEILGDVTTYPWCGHPVDDFRIAIAYVNGRTVAIAWLTPDYYGA